MLELQLRKVKFGVDFSFLAVIAIFFCGEACLVGILSLAACVLHESAHLAVMLLKKTPPDSVVLYGGGIRISRPFSVMHNVYVVLAGSAANLALFALLFVFYRENSPIMLFAAANLLIGLFNLLPVACLDGKFLLEIGAEHFLPQKASAKLVDIAGKAVTIALAVACVYLAVHSEINFSLAAVVGYILIMEVAGRSG